MGPSRARGRSHLRVKYFLANWKMHTTVGQAVAWLDTVQGALRDRARAGRHVPTPIVCPPFVSLAPLRAVMDRHLLRLGAQSCHWEPEGPYTGEISAPMLRDIADYVMVGHSERRAAGESDDDTARKVKAVADVGLVPILFVGEEKPSEAAAEESEKQLRRGLSGIEPDRHEVLVVYEPAWAVGAEQPAGADHVAEQVERLKGLLAQLGARDPEVIYGGTVNDENIEQFANLAVIDGVGATRASLDARRFLDMIDRLGDTQRGAPARDGP